MVYGDIVLTRRELRVRPQTWISQIKDQQLALDIHKLVPRKSESSKLMTGPHLLAIGDAAAHELGPAFEQLYTRTGHSIDAYADC
jgi:hypothetical protein